MSLAEDARPEVDKLTAKYPEAFKFLRSIGIYRYFVNIYCTTMYIKFALPDRQVLGDLACLGISIILDGSDESSAQFIRANKETPIFWMKDLGVDRDKQFEFTRTIFGLEYYI